MPVSPPNSSGLAVIKACMSAITALVSAVAWAELSALKPPREIFARSSKMAPISARLA